MAEDLDDHRRIFDACPERVEGAAMIFKAPPQLGSVRCRYRRPVLAAWPRSHQIVVGGEAGFEVGLGCHRGLLIDVSVHVAGIEIPRVRDTNENIEPRSMYL